MAVTRVPSTSSGQALARLKVSCGEARSTLVRSTNKAKSVSGIAKKRMMRTDLGDEFEKANPIGLGMILPYLISIQLLTN